MDNVGTGIFLDSITDRSSDHIFDSWRTRNNQGGRSAVTWVGNAARMVHDMACGCLRSEAKLRVYSLPIRSFQASIAKRMLPKRSCQVVCFIGLDGSSFFPQKTNNA